jgi:hypothetical protein
MESILNSLVLLPPSVIQLEIRISYMLKFKKAIEKMSKVPLGYCRKTEEYCMNIRECEVLRICC